jgi:GNAT superfamily N-acetyltransferase
MVSDASEVASFYVDIMLDTVPTIHPVPEVIDHLTKVMFPRGTSHVWEEDGVVLAWLDVGDGWVNQLICRRSSTGLGIGKQLLDFAKSVSPDGLQLYTFQVNAGARRFYIREGFKEVELGDGSGNEERQPDVRMEWRPK